MAGTQFKFSMTPFPKEVYEKLQEIRKVHELTQRECLMVAMAALQHVGKASPQIINKIVEQIKEKYRAPEEPKS